jgi:hypothetical protein
LWYLLGLAGMILLFASLALLASGWAG